MTQQNKMFKDDYDSLSDGPEAPLCKSKSVFMREERYLVLKHSDIRNALSELERNILCKIVDKIYDYRVSIMEKDPLSCVVVEREIGLNTK